MNLEKQMLKEISDRTKLNCKKKNADRSCSYYKMSELDFLNKVRMNQIKRSLKILKKKKKLAKKKKKFGKRKKEKN